MSRVLESSWSTEFSKKNLWNFEIFILTSILIMILALILVLMLILKLILALQLLKL